MVGGYEEYHFEYGRSLGEGHGKCIGIEIGNRDKIGKFYERQMKHFLKRNYGNRH